MAKKQWRLMQMPTLALPSRLQRQLCRSPRVMNLQCRSRRNKFTRPLLARLKSVSFVLMVVFHCMSSYIYHLVRAVFSRVCGSGAFLSDIKCDTADGRIGYWPQVVSAMRHPDGINAYRQGIFHAHTLRCSLCRQLVFLCDRAPRLAAGPSQPRTPPMPCTAPPFRITRSL